MAAPDRRCLHAAGRGRRDAGGAERREERERRGGPRHAPARDRAPARGRHAPDRRHAASVLLVDEERRRRLPGVEVRPILPGEVDAGDYQPRPEDIKKLADLDAIVVNGIGHDDFIVDMIKASGNTRIIVIRPNDGDAEDPLDARRHGQLAHVHLVHERHPADLRDREGARGAAAATRRRVPEERGRLRAPPARDQGRRPRPQLADAKIKRVVTVHDGYGYLCRSSASRSPAWSSRRTASSPSAKELGDMVELHQAREDPGRVQRGDVPRAAAEGAARREPRARSTSSATSPRARTPPTSSRTRCRRTSTRWSRRWSPTAEGGAARYSRSAS